MEGDMVSFGNNLEDPWIGSYFGPSLSVPQKTSANGTKGNVAEANVGERVSVLIFWRYWIFPHERSPFVEW